MKKLINGIKKLFKMNFDVDALMALKNSFQGQKFQMVKGKGPKLGKVFTVVDVEPTRGGYFAMFNDGSKVSVDSLNSSFMMLMDEQPPMSAAEIASINDGYTAPVSTREIAPGLDIPADIAAEMNTQPAPKPVQAAPVQESKPAQPQPSQADLFGMFALEDTTLNLSIQVKLPNRSLLKAMYSNSQDQTEFINKLSAYINNSVSADSIKDSLWKMLDPEKKKKLNDKSS